MDYRLPSHVLQCWRDQVSSTKSFVAVLMGSSSVDNVPDLGVLALHKGEPAFWISKKDMQVLAKPYRNALIGRFTYSRPSMEVIRSFFMSLGSKGGCSVGLLDSNHILIRPTTEKDYIRLFTRRTWFIQKAPMVISK